MPAPRVDGKRVTVKVLRAASSVTVAKEKRAGGGEQRSHLVAYRGRTSEREGLKKQKLRQADPTKRTLRGGAARLGAGQLR